MYGQTPQFPGAARPGRNGLAVAALVLGLVGGTVLAFAFGIAALVQIGRRGQRGRGFAVAGMAAATVWLAAIAAGAVAAVALDGGADGSGAGASAGVGDCVEFPASRAAGEISEVPCQGTHEGEIVASFTLPEKPKPTLEGLRKAADERCGQEVRKVMHTVQPVEGGEIVSVRPELSGWADDRTVRCAVAGPLSQPLWGRLADRPYEVRLWNELQPGDCFDVPGVPADGVRLPGCARPHDAQLTHRFSLTGSRYPGGKVVERRAGAGCRKRWLPMIRGNPRLVRLSPWASWPTRATWTRSGDRRVLCAFTGKDGARLDQTVVPGVAPAAWHGRDARP